MDRLTWLVAITADDHSPVGLGVAIKPHHVVTCAHVVAAALGLRETPRSAPEGTIRLESPSDRRPTEGTVVCWHPEDDQMADPLQDICLLKHDHPDIVMVDLADLLAQKPQRGHAVEVLGFPNEWVGIVSRGYTLAGPVNNNWWQLDPPQSPLFTPIDRGFSGSLVWDVDRDAPVGLVVYRAKPDDFSPRYLIPSAILHEACCPTLIRSAPWVSSSGEDSYGQWVDFRVHGVTSRLRWIPAPRPSTPKIETGFWLGETPVTQELWQTIMHANPSEFQNPHHPVETVSWTDCCAFLRNLRTEVPGLDPRVPSEAEWEYACRAGMTTSPSRSDLDAAAWFYENIGDLRGPRPVRQKQPNTWGLYDMLGNVWEWCAATDRRGAHIGTVRGSAWDTFADYVDFSASHLRSHENKANNLGFRLACG